MADNILGNKVGNNIAIDSAQLDYDVTKRPESLTQRLIQAANYNQRQKTPFVHRDWRDGRDRERTAALVEGFIGVLNTRVGLIKTYESLRNLDVVQTILDVVQDDGFNSSQEPEVFTVYYEPEKSEDEIEFNDGKEEEAYISDVEEDNKEEDELVEKINEEISAFVENVGLVDFVTNNLEDILLYGEYPFRIVAQEGRGITEIVDDVDPASVIAFYEGAFPKFFIERIGNTVVIRSTEEMGHFCLDSRKIRIKITDLKSKIPEVVPEYVRVGRSIIYQAISKLKRLQVFEMAAVADALKKILTPILVGVGVPAAATPQDTADIVKKYEIELAAPSTPNATDPGSFTFYDIFELVGRVKVLPNFSDGKGTVGTVDITTGQQQADVDAKEDRLRLAIAKACGIPSYYIALTEDNGQSKLETLKVFSRYSRRLTTIQTSISDGIRRLVSTHLSMKGLAVRSKNIKVRFKSLVNMDLLDSVEYTAASVDIMNDLFSALETIVSSDNSKLRMNPEKLLNLLNTFLSPMAGAEGVLELDEDKMLGQGDDMMGGGDMGMGGADFGGADNTFGGGGDLGGGLDLGGGGLDLGTDTGSASPEEQGSMDLTSGPLPLPQGGESTPGPSDRLQI